MSRGPMALVEQLRKDAAVLRQRGGHVFCAENDENGHFLRWRWRHEVADNLEEAANLIQSEFE